MAREQRLGDGARDNEATERIRGLFPISDSPGRGGEMDSVSDKKADGTMRSDGAQG